MGLSNCRLSLFNSPSLGMYSANPPPSSQWHCREHHACDVHVPACVDSRLYVRTAYSFISACVSCLALKWYMMRLCCPSNQCSQPPPISFYRKLIGGCHWCVKLLCVGRCRQLDYLFFMVPILEQLPSALLLFLNEILFPSVALKDTVCNCSKASHGWSHGFFLSCGLIQSSLHFCYECYYCIKLRPKFVSKYKLAELEGRIRLPI